ncbi:MAG: 16S rRNA (adenine(1518)-N(6)/adenine(1519)-N(6))-dimethyltransferase RsmA [Patescibacteria group bacterium]
MYSFHAKKSLGQHFLRSKDAIKKIVATAEIVPGETVLEIGPGEGALTEALLEAGARVVAVEADARCILKLEERFVDAIKVKKLLLIHGDARDKKIQAELFQKKFLGVFLYKLVANIPYYITGMLFRLFLEKLRQPSLLVFLVQKEVARQVTGRSGKESVLSLAVKVFGTPCYVAKVKREAFSPSPKVDSAIILITDISRVRLKELSDEEYFRVVKAGLGSKRKMLLGNLSRGLDIPKEKLGTVFRKSGIGLYARGEDIPVEKWIALAIEIKKI